MCVLLLKTYNYIYLNKLQKNHNKKQKHIKYIIRKKKLF